LAWAGRAKAQTAMNAAAKGRRKRMILNPPPRMPREGVYHNRRR
jgi:hypothetical protein